MPGVHLIWLESPQIASLAQPGQFIMVRCGEDTLLRRPLSFHSVVMGRFAVLFTVIGRGTQWLSQRQTGDILDILGPLGNSFTLPNTPQEILLVAGGIGFAPLRFLAEEANRQGNRVTLFMGVPKRSKLLPSPILEDPLGHELFAAFHNIFRVTEDGSEGYKGMVTDLLVDRLDKVDRLVHIKDTTQVFACGPLPMYKTMSGLPLLKNKPVQVSLEVRMACGRGFCYGCTIKTKHGLKKVCADGPVFELDDILWDELNSL
ncbi:MAG: dihydroorotate dehydrogenase electron transfer subunit [Chloroflexi bacterium]|nr:dihydroorotate dehydrogenase electron transfer subunit [Chloroflexota bacterium]